MALIRKQIYQDADADGTSSARQSAGAFPKQPLSRERLQHAHDENGEWAGDPQARAELMRMWGVRQESKKYFGKGRDLSLDREELYKERLDRHMPR